MSLPSAEAKKRVTSLMRLERKIEETAIDEPRQGFIRNQFGTYDNAGATQKLLDGFEKLTSEYPEEEYFATSSQVPWHAPAVLMRRLASIRASFLVAVSTAVHLRCSFHSCIGMLGTRSWRRKR
jgi:hypothetical protein